jgi:hypothetical protein
MPTDNTTVGPLALPIASGAANEALEDRTLLGLLDYLGHWLRESLSAKVSDQQGPTTSDAIADACPTENLFPWNHHGTFVRRNADDVLPLPGLWAWEESQEATTEHATLLYEVVRREIRVQYIFPQLTAPKGVAARHGLIPAVSRVFAKAAERGRRSDYGFDGDDDNTAIWDSCAWRAFKYRGGQAVAAAMLPSGDRSQGAARAAGAEKRFFPSFVATFWIWERIGLQEPDDGEELGVGDLTISVGDDVPDEDAIDVMVREFPADEDE